MPWVTLAVLVAALAASLGPGFPDALGYERAAIGRGDWWRPLTGQLVQESLPRALALLGVFVVVGAWLESRSRIGLLTSLILSALGTAAMLLWGLPDLQRFVGLSGVVCGLVAFSAAWLARNGTQPVVRGLALAVLVALTGALLLEARGAAGWSQLGGPVEVHLAGAGAGLVAAALAPLWRRR